MGDCRSRLNAQIFAFWACLSDQLFNESIFTSKNWVRTGKNLKLAKFFTSFAPLSFFSWSTFFSFLKTRSLKSFSFVLLWETFIDFCSAILPRSLLFRLKPDHNSDDFYGFPISTKFLRSQHSFVSEEEDEIKKMYSTLNVRPWKVIVFSFLLS